MKQVTNHAPPYVKGATALQGLGGLSNANEPVGANNSNAKTPGNSPLGYFEDEPF